MRCNFFVVVVCSVVTSRVVAAQSDTFRTIDIQSKANVKLTDDFHADNPGNNLAELKQGEQTLAGVKFSIGPKCIQLGSPVLKESGRDFPPAVKEIPVDSRVEKFHLLHALGYGTVYEEQPQSLPKDKVVARLKATYDDGSTHVFSIEYGEDLVDWWYVPGSPNHAREPKRANVAWEGSNAVTKAISDQAGIRAVIRLYLSTWKNPNPEKNVKSLEYATADAGLPSAPFCVAVTVEKK
jgi:hypothetical protein